MNPYLNLIMIPLLAPTGNLLADEVRWEAGVGIGALSIPHYPGSDENQDLILPLPYGSYEDKKTKIDRSGINYNLFGVKDLDLSFSVAIGLPVNSKDNKARQGMKDLNALLEVGPAVKYWLYQTENNKLSFEVPARLAFNFDDFSASQSGFAGNVKLRYEYKNEGWKLNTTLSQKFADRDYLGRYYDVETAYVTPDRPAYRARKGNAGHSLTLGVSRRFGRFYIGFFNRYENLEHAANRESSLVKTRHNWYSSVLFSWVFASSEY